MVVDKSAWIKACHSSICFDEKIYACIDTVKQTNT